MHMCPAASHDVQFYEDDGFLAASVAEFLAQGVAAGEPAVVIATPAHRWAFANALERRLTGAEADGLTAAPGQVLWLDAEQTLARFMVGAMPSGNRFRAAIIDILDARGSGAARTVRLFGEMVDLLWQAGNPEAALRVEELWNELAERRLFSLLCAYRMTSFAAAADTAGCEAVCRHHTHVRPAERYSTASSTEQMVEVVRLQQQAQRLDQEMQRRFRSDSQLALERNLREREHREADARRVGAIGTLAAGVAHHLNGLLTSVLTNAELLRARIVPGGDDHALAEEITHAARRAAEVARHLLVYVGRPHQASKAVDVGALARDVIAGLAPTLSPEAKLTLQIGDNVPPVMGDRAQLAEALTQFIRNAVEALPGGSGAVMVRVADGPAHVELEVADAGAGMTRDVRGRMFEPFFSTKAVGRGLGLATAMGIVQAHGGSVAVTSAPGRGTTVRVLLPPGDERSASTG